MADPEPVSVRDLEVADRIARGVRGGRPADARPTLEQLLAAFGEAEPTADARRRAARALALAGVATMPDLLEALPGQRVLLEVRRVRRRRALLLGLLALIVLFAAAVALASQVDFGNDDSAADLPADTTATASATATATTATNTVTGQSTPTTTSKPPPTATKTATGTIAPTTGASAPTTGASTPPTAAEPPPTATRTVTGESVPTNAAKPAPTSAERRRALRARERRAAARRARARRVKAARARRARAARAAKRRVTVRLNATSPTFLCVEGDGKELFNGTLSGARTFRGRVVRLNIGLGPSTRLTANGKAVPLTASPTGLQLTPTRRTFLPLGSRPCA